MVGTSLTEGMPSVYPGALPPAGSASSTDTLAAAGHTSLHNTDRDGILAVATKVGTGASTPVDDAFLVGNGAGSSSWEAAATARSSIGLGNVDNSSDVTILGKAYPVGSIYMNATNSTNPATLLGFGTWSAFGQGRVLVGLNSSDTDFDTAEETGGAKTHTLTEAELPSHRHFVMAATTTVASLTNSNQLAWGRSDAAGEFHYGADNGGTATAATVGLTSATGSGSAHNNLQPYIVVYMWKRTA